MKQIKTTFLEGESLTLEWLFSYFRFLIAHWKLSNSMRNYFILIPNARKIVNERLIIDDLKNSKLIFNTKCLANFPSSLS